MSVFQWDDSLSVGISEIDMQHKKLIKSLNDLTDAMRQRKGKEVVGKIINDMVGYVAIHFKTEERYFDRFGYPDSFAHKKEHADFAQKISEFQKDFDAGVRSMSIELNYFLSNWLLNHIRGSDQKYAPFLHEKGIS